MQISCNTERDTRTKVQLLWVSDQAEPDWTRLDWTVELFIQNKHLELKVEATKPLENEIYNRRPLFLEIFFWFAINK